MKIAVQFKESARAALKGKWGISVGAGLIAGLLGSTGSASSSSVSTNINTEGSSEIEFDLTELINSVGLERVFPAFGAVLAVIIAYEVVGIVLGSVVGVGYSKFNLDLIDKKAPALSTLFNYFKIWGTAVCAEILRTLYIIVGAILFIIPGILATYNYAMTQYVLAENENLSATEALVRSKSLMIGNRWRLFCLQLSFIGWDLLCVLSLGIGSLWLVPYKAAAYADFYREISDTRPSEADGAEPQDNPSYEFNDDDRYTDL
jgi:uncharacterized membrane protein